MNVLEVLRQTAGSIAAHKLRSFLTMFGIIWGITSVILLVGLGKGFSRDQKERLKTSGLTWLSSGEAARASRLEDTPPGALCASRFAMPN